VLAGYDWVVKNLAIQSLGVPGSSQARYSMAGQPLIRLGVTGELIGGGLAMMLGLTEVRLGESRVVAVGVGNPIVDWVFLEEDATPLASGSSEVPELGITHPDLERGAEDESAAQDKQDIMMKSKPQKEPKHTSSWTRQSKIPPLDTTTMANARTFCFPSAKPATYFDPFASPILFLRLSGADIPASREYTIEDDFQALFGMQADEALAGTTTPGHMQTEQILMRSEEAKSKETKQRRKTTRRYPPAGMALRIPSVRICAGRATVLADQASEMVRLMRKAEARMDMDQVGAVDEGLIEDVLGWNEHRIDGVGYDRHRAAEAEDEEDEMVRRLKIVKLATEKKIMLDMVDGDGLWCGEGGKSDVVSVGKWIGDVLSR